MNTISEATASVVPLEELSLTPLTQHTPNVCTLPFVVGSPHSGRVYPREFLQLSPLSGLEIRRSEDAYADLLFETSEIPVPKLTANFPRAYIDVNRSPQEIDVDMFDDPIAFPTERTLHVVSGFGIIPRLIREGCPIHREKLSLHELTMRIEKFYFPYHRALSTLMKDTRAHFGHALLIDCHTMPATEEIADIVLGDRYGTSAPPTLMRRAECCFAAQGFSVARNQPYAGGHITGKYARPDDNFYAMQIEVKRSLYMNEDTLEPLPEFFAVRNRISAALRALINHFRLERPRSKLRRAAE